MQRASRDFGMSMALPNHPGQPATLRVSTDGQHRITCCQGSGGSGDFGGVVAAGAFIVPPAAAGGAGGLGGSGGGYFGVAWTTLAGNGAGGVRGEGVVLVCDVAGGGPYVV